MTSAGDFPHQGIAKITARPDDWPRLISDLNNLELVSFEGAGVTGVVYTGAMKALHEKNLLGKVKRFAGTSSGAIVAAGAALGYRGDELIEIALDQSFRSFCRTNGTWLRKLRHNLERDGLFSGGEMRRWVNNLCARRIGQSGLTFADLEEYREQAEAGNREFFVEKYRWAMEHKSFFRRYSRDRAEFQYDFERGNEQASIDAMMEIAKGLRSLEIGATEIWEDENGKKQEKAALFNEVNSPNLSIANAVRASAAYPYVFRNAIIEDEQGVKRTYTDGGYTVPLPLHSLDGPKGESNKALGFVSEYFPDKPQELGINPKVGRAAQQLKKMIARTVGRKHIEKHNITRQTPLEAGLVLMNKDTARFHEMGQVRMATPELTSRIIPLDRDGENGTNFEITRERKSQLIQSAYATTKAAVERWLLANQSKESGLIGDIKPKDKIRPAEERNRPSGGFLEK